MKTFKRIFSTLAIVCMIFVAMFSFASCKAPEVVSIAVTTEPTKTTYVAGQTFDPTGMVVTATLDNEKTRVLEAEEYTYAPNDALKISNKKVTITYQELTCTVNIKVTNEISSAEIKTHATKTEYVSGETFDPTGLVVTITREDGSKQDITVAESSTVSYSTDPLVQGQTSVQLKAGEVIIEESITVSGGIFIEAETGQIVSSTVDINTDSEDASGGAYVGDLKAGDSVTFYFKADKAGVGDFEFIMASTYLKEDDNWTPIWMGDCQLNKICDVVINDATPVIADDVILLGGGQSGGEPDSTLWFHWQPVVLKDVALVEGINTVKLTFKNHDYTDTSQSSFSGAFVPNVDSLKVVTSDVTITPVNSAISFEATSAYVKLIDNVPTFAYTYSVEYDPEFWAVEDIKNQMASYKFDFQYNSEYNGNGNWEYALQDAGVAHFDEATKTAEYRVDISTLGNGGWVSHCNGDVKFEAEITEQIHNMSITANGKTYTIFAVNGATTGMEFWGCVAVIVADAPAA